MTTRKTKTSAQIEAEIKAARAAYNAEQDARRKELRATKAREHRAAEAERAKRDRALADALLRRLRESFADDATDDELLAAMDRLLLCSIDGRQAPEWALHAVRRDAMERSNEGA